MTDRQALYEGKAKIIYAGPDDDTLVQFFKDDATAFNAQKKDVIAAGSVCPRLGLTEGDPLPSTLVEFCLKDDALGDPIIAREHILTFGWATAEEFDAIVVETHRINTLLSDIFAGIDVRLIDFKLEFGRPKNGGGGIMLADEISPDNCRLWQVGTDEKMDKDRFRRDLGGLTDAYREIARRLGVTIPETE